MSGSQVGTKLTDSLRRAKGAKKEATQPATVKAANQPADTTAETASPEEVVTPMQSNRVWPD